MDWKWRNDIGFGRVLLTQIKEIHIQKRERDATFKYECSNLKSVSKWNTHLQKMHHHIRNKITDLQV